MVFDLDTLDDAAGMSTAYPAIVQAFINTTTDTGSFWHVVLGTLSAFMPGAYPLATALMFSGYEVSKLAAGESAERVAGSMMEWGFGLLAGTFAQRAGWVK